MKKLTPILLFIFSLSNLVAQNQSIFNIQSKFGIAIFEKLEDPTNKSEENIYSTDPGLNFSGGFSYCNKTSSIVNFNIGILYEKAKFSRITNSPVPSNPFTTINQTTYQFKTESLLVPFNFQLEVEKWLNLSFGVICIRHFSTVLNISERSIVNGVKSKATNKGTYKDGDNSTYTYYVGGNHWTNLRGGKSKVKLENKLNFQFSLGCHFKLSQLLNLDVEYRQYFTKNRLNSITHSSKTSFLPFAKTLSAGISFNIFK